MASAGVTRQAVASSSSSRYVSASGRKLMECVADQRLTRLGFAPVYGSENPFSFMELQGVQELTNFFERRPSAYQVAVEGTVDLDEDF